jgi:hypothetical protein
MMGMQGAMLPPGGGDQDVLDQLMAQYAALGAPPPLLEQLRAYHSQNILNSPQQDAADPRLQALVQALRGGQPPMQQQGLNVGLPDEIYSQPGLRMGLGYGQGSPGLRAPGGAYQQGLANALRVPTR